MKPKNRYQWLQASAANFSKKPLAYQEYIEMPLEVIKDARILDYGCGNGGDAMVFCKNGGFVDVADILKENLFATRKNCEAAGLRISKFIYLEHSDRINVDKETYDVISSNGVLHHIEFVEPVIDELWRVTKMGGLLYVMLYSEFLLEEHLDKICAWGGNWNHLFGTLTDGCDYTTFYTPDKVKNVFKGFELLESCLFFNNQFRIYKLKKVKK